MEAQWKLEENVNWKMLFVGCRLRNIFLKVITLNIDTSDAEMDTQNATDIFKGRFTSLGFKRESNNKRARFFPDKLTKQARLYYNIMYLCRLLVQNF